MYEIEDISEQVFIKRLNDFFDKSKSDAAAGRKLNLHRAYIGQMRKGIRPAHKKVVAAMGYKEIKEVPPIVRTYRRVSND